MISIWVSILGAGIGCRPAVVRHRLAADRIRCLGVATHCRDGTVFLGEDQRYRQIRAKNEVWT